MDGFDAAGNQVTTTNALDQTTLTVYDGANRPIIHVANWDGTTIVTETQCAFPPAQPDTNLCTVTYYDALGRRSATKDPLGHLTEYSYDARGRLIATTRYLNGAPVVTTNQYDIGGTSSAGNLIAQTDANGHTTRYFYDELNRLVRTISPEGVETAQMYNAAGQVVTTTDGLGRATVNAYDALGRLVSVTDPEGNITRYKYDGLGNQVAVTDANGTRTAYEYDSLNRLVAVVENQRTGESANWETNVRTEYAYDILGNRLVITNALGYRLTHTTYDALGRPVVVEDALGNKTYTQYNALGYRTVVTDANGMVTRYHYDGLNRLVEVEYVGESTVQYAYDAAGHRTAMTDTVGVTLYTYDDGGTSSAGRLIQVDDPLTGTVQYGYDLVGNRTQLIYPTGQTITYTYDADNRLTRVEDWDGGVTIYAYDAAGQLITTTLPNGVVSVNAYDDAGRLIRIEHTHSDLLLARYSYALDELGNRVRAVETLNDKTRVITYTYNALNRLTASTYSTGEQFAYRYDAVGNRTRYTETLTQTIVITYVYDAANRLTQVGDTSYTWDDNGNLTNDGLFTYAWNAAGRLVMVQNVTHTVAYTYNGDGVRVAQQIGESAISYIQTLASHCTSYNRSSNSVCGLPQVLVETRGTESTLYVYGLSRLAQVQAGSTGWFLGDALGSVRQLVDDSGDVVLARDYDPYGQVLAESGTGESGYGFTGEQYDAATELLFLRARYYALGTGRFLSQDPWQGSIQQPGTLHKYVYALNNAINRVDPGGKQSYFDPGGGYECWTPPPTSDAPTPREYVERYKRLEGSYDDVYTQLGAC